MRDAIYAVSDADSLIVDYFAGSGTTGDAVMMLNREEKDSSRKYILVEMGDYFDTVLKPRLLKAAFSTDWKDGVPRSLDGTSHMIKYQRIESYEDTLNNIHIQKPNDNQLSLLVLQPQIANLSPSTTHRYAVFDGHAPPRQPKRRLR